MDRVVLYDTTLRDGTQRANISLTVADKIRIARRLDEFGIHYIEGGWPGSNPKDQEFFNAMRSTRLHHARLAAFSSTRRPGVRAEDDAIVQALLAAQTPTVCIFGKSWDFHVTDALMTTLDENLAMISETVAYLKAQGREVIYDGEHFFDGFKANREYALATLQAAAAAGADWIVPCDTNGGTLPHDLGEILAVVRRTVRSPLGIHPHDDSGVGVANALTAVAHGVTMVQGTINGYGERCGNANLVAIIPNLQLKMGRPCVPPENLKQLTNLSYFVSELANLPPWDAQPYVGRNAFAHKGGIHVSAVRKHVSMYEHIAPEVVGNERRVMVSELAGRSNLQYLFGDAAVSPTEAAALVEQVKELEHKGYHFEGAEASLHLRLRRLRGEQPPFELVNFRVIIEQRGGEEPYAEASIKVRVGERILHTVAEGNGPVNALDAALRRALQDVFPSLADMALTDYKVRVLEGADGTGAQVRVLVESSDGRRRWGTVGVSANIIEASWLAVVDSVEYFLYGQQEIALPAAVSTAT